MLYSTMRNEHASTGDLLVVEGKSLVSRLIRMFTGQTYSHVSVIAFIDEAKTCMMTVEMKEFRGWNCMRASDWFEDTISAGSNVFFIKKPEEITNEDAIYSYLFERRKLKYDYMGLFKIWRSTWKKKGLRGAIEDRTAEVCSTFAASAWASAGWQKPDIDFNPGSFMLHNAGMHGVVADPETNSSVDEVAVLDTESDNTV